MSIHMPLTVPAFEQQAIEAPAGMDGSMRRLWLSVAAVWALNAVVMLACTWSRVADLSMWDTDDYMRLAQVRDWIGGQSFFDVTQYRFDPPRGFAMHWSRIVDLPIAGLMMLLSPLAGPALAERIAVTLVPLLTLGGIMTGAALTTLRLAGHRAAPIAALIATTAPTVLFCVLPLRIDHHGWQGMMAALTLAACFDPHTRRGGAAAGVCAAIWLAVSMEGLPLVTAFGTMHGVRFIIEGRRYGADRRLRAFAAGLGLASVTLFVALHGLHSWSRSYGDMLSPAWLSPLGLTPILVACLVPVAVDRGIEVRLGLLVAVAAIGVAMMLRMDAQILAGPFASLDPLVRAYWYNNVSEGLPIWKQSRDMVMILAPFSIVGLAGTLWASRTAPDEATRRNWRTMLCLATAAFAVSIFVQRAGAVSHIYMLPGTAVVLLAMLASANRQRRPIRRVLTSVGAIVICLPLLIASAGMAALRFAAPAVPTVGETPALCDEHCDPFGALNRLPPSYILSSLDVGPMLLVKTRHRFLASGYHRNGAAIHDVIAAFIEPSDHAHRLMTARGMRYILINPEGPEATIYRHGPQSLMTVLVAGRAPAWLKPVPLPHSPYRLWRRTD